jgi:hypothetical protein
MDRIEEVRHTLDLMLQATKCMLIGPCEMAPCPLPIEVASAIGTWSGDEVRLDTQILEGSSALHRLHLARGRGAMESLTVLALPDPDRNQPLFAADIVAFRGKFAVVFLDLCSVGGTSSFVPSAATRQARERLLAASRVRDVPNFCRGILSDHPVLVSEGERAEMADRIAACYLAYVGAFADSLLAPCERRDGGAHAQRDFLQRMGENKREAKALAKLFGEPWADAFLTRHFFGRDAVRRPRGAAPSRAPVASPAERFAAVA